jgi:hypothetical protein
MTIATLHRPLSLTLATLGLISLVACGGGGGGGGGGNSSSSAPVAVDTTPNAISFAATENAEPNAQITSPAVTISGINAATPISITGGEYSIAGGAFTSTAGTISNGQTLTVRVTASDKTNTPKEITVTVGGVSAKFVVTTLADTTPDAFAFTAKTDVAVNSEHTSEVATINGIDIAVPVSITGGLYSIHGAEFTSATGTVFAGQTIAVKTTAANKTDTTQNAVLSVGSISSTFAVTTIPDTTPPVAEFKFPTPYTMSEANSVKVRGTATDDHAITSVKLVVRSYKLETPNETISSVEITATPKAEGDYSSWTAEVPLTTLAENEIKVVATDDRNNSTVTEMANKIAIRQAPIVSAFPDELNQFGDTSGGIIIDKLNGRNRLLVSDPSEAKIYSASIATGERSLYKDLGSSNSDVRGMVIDDSVEVPVLYANEYIEGNILKINLADGATINTYHSDLYQRSRALVLEEKDDVKRLVSINPGEFDRNSDVVAFNLQTEEFFTVFSDVDYSLIPSTNGFALDKSRNRYLATVRDSDSNLYGIYSIDRTTGKRQPFSTNEVGAGELFPDRTALQGIAIDEEKSVMYVPEYRSGKLFAIELDTGERRVAADLSYTNADGVITSGIISIQIDSSAQITYVGDTDRDSVLVVDVLTGEKVILSKSKNDF